MKCTSCGAEIQPGATTCEYCDSSIEILAANGDRVWLFEHVKRSDVYARRDSPERLAAMPKTPAIGNVVLIGFLVIWTLGSGFIMVMAWGMAGVASAGFGPVGLIPLAMSIVPMAFVGLGVFMIIKTVRKMKQYNEAPVEANPAVIVSKRTQVSGGSDDSSSSTYYFVTAEFEDGRRQEFRPARTELFGRIAEGDAGILFCRTDVALDFDRVAAQS